MSKTSFLLGLIVAAGAHLLLFWPGIKAPAQPQEPRVEPIPPISMVQPPPPEQPKPEPKPKPKPEPKVQPRPEPKPEAKPQPKPQPKPEPKLARTTPPPQPEPVADDLVGNTAPKQTPESIDDDALPPLRITWDSPAELKRVAARMGMRIVGVNFQGEILGEIDPNGSSRLVEFHGQMSNYSNRVRTLPTGFFGPNLADDEQPVAELWILVPAGIDRAWMDMQKRAIAQTGLKVEQVRSIEGRFASVGDGYRLTVTRIISNPGT
ncbi:MAG: hypothetical protein ACLFUJ_10675 [Phycisphaerae bacterium]